LATSKKRLFSVTFYVVQYCMILSQNSDYFSLVASSTTQEGALLSCLRA
jgi:hypothetical protein